MQIPETENLPLISNTSVVLGLLMVILGLVFYTSNLSNKYVKGFFNIIPPLLLCYFLPGLLNSFNIIDGANSPLTSIGSNYLLPTCLILFVVNLDLKEMWALRKRAGLMFITGTIGIIIGGPLAVWLTSLVAPEVVGGATPNEVWKGLGSLAGSWIGGSANQVALKEILQPSPQVFSAIIAVDVFVAYLWMAFLLYGASKSKQFDKFFKAESSDVEALKEKMDAMVKANSRTPETKDLIYIVALAFGGTALSALIAEPLSSYMATNHPELAKFSLTSNFFWVIFIASVIGIILSFTPAKKLEYVGASKVATVFLYILITTIGMQMDITAIAGNPGLLVVGLIWMSVHALLLLIVGKIFKVPFFYFAVGSMANVGGVASASVTSAAFHPSLISVGVILAVFGYAIGTYAGWFTAILMQMVAPM